MTCIIAHTCLKRFFQTRSRSEAEEDAQGQRQHQNEVNRSSHRNSNNNMSPLVARLSRPSRGMIQILKETSNRATAFIIGYIMTYIFSAIYRILETYSGYTPFGIIILARFFLPLQGEYEVVFSLELYIALFFVVIVVVIIIFPTTHTLFFLYCFESSI